MSEERRRPIKLFEVIVAHGPYRVGDRLQPTGLYRDVLLRRGFIKEVVEASLQDRAVQPELDRMMPPAAGLLNRDRKRAR